MRFNNGSTDGQAQTGAMSPGEKERVEDVICLLRRQPPASIGNQDQQALIFGLPRVNGELAPPVHLLRRKDGIDHINRGTHQCSLQLQAMRHHLGKMGGNAGAERSRVSGCLAAQKDDHLLKYFPYINALPAAGQPS